MPSIEVDVSLSGGASEVAEDDSGSVGVAVVASVDALVGADGTNGTEVPPQAAVTRSTAAPSRRGRMRTLLTPFVTGEPVSPGPGRLPRLRGVNPAVLADLVRTVAVEVLADRGLDSTVLPETVTVERPRNPEHGDYATNLALQVGKRLGVQSRSWPGGWRRR
ncbi:hypothetical protein GCM10029964_108460 [Kibdelosporangium lantanae]